MRAPVADYWAGGGGGGIWPAGTENSPHDGIRLLT